MSNQPSEITTEDIPLECIFHILENYCSEKNVIIVASSSKKNWIFSVCARSDRIWINKYEKAKIGTSIDHLLISEVIEGKKGGENSYLKYMTLKAQERNLRREEMKKKPLIDFEYYEYGEKEGMDNIKAVFVGDGATGKTCLLISYTVGEFPSDYIPTVFDVCRAVSIFREKEVCLQTWDTGESVDDYDRTRVFCYPGTDVFSIIFSLVDPWSLENVKTKWLPEIQRFANDNNVQRPPIVLVGTKLDLREDKDSDILRRLQEHGKVPVSTGEGEKVAKEIKAVAYFETSAKTREGVMDCFQGIIGVGLKAQGIDYYDGKVKDGGLQRC